MSAISAFDSPAGSGSAKRANIVAILLVDLALHGRWRRAKANDSPSSLVLGDVGNLQPQPRDQDPELGFVNS
jgi:hypothetical protein